MIDIDKLRSVIAIAVDALIYINVLRLFIKIPRNKYIKLYLLFFIFSTTIHNQMQYLYYLKAAIVFVVYGIINRFLLNVSFLKNVFLVFIFAVITLLGDVVGVFSLMATLGVTMMEIQNDTRLFFALKLLSFVTITLLLYIMKYILLYKTYGKEIQIRSKNMLLYMVTVFSMLFINLYTFLYHVGQMKVFISMIHIVLVVAYITISFNYTFLENDFYYQKILFKNQQEYLLVIENLLNGYRELKHGWKNYLTGFSGFIYAEEKDWDALVEYYESVVKTTKHLTNDSLSVLVRLKNHSLLGMFVEKINEAETQGIHVNINVIGEEIKLQEDYDFLMDLNFILGNFLDNAIRHAVFGDMPMLWITIDYREEYINFIIKNTFKDTDEGDNQRFDSGHGLRLVTEKIKKYPFMIHNTVIDEDIFIQELIMECKDIKSYRDFEAKKEAAL
ncbi:two-component system, AgrA family, sensor histidine kinase AgrC [Anaerovirgula multivorans]|uniref:Two-component system, AgrA family, sensor histidine kinase AgrC n=1 Tax=Anaerovirgula multivorans TaxID=312168 RepID=A0A239FKK4_9FIRM|nr:GHKL domain-containing protein [Anaerovirgula multivorans]SNS57450.1 two-component system, AgrA family, sensor histidine kinase AgrC [Anaerovirgula multivorans]